MEPLTTFRRGRYTFDVDDSGGTGTLVVLLHGFPQSRSMWHGLTPALTAAGYRVVAPDQRGYSPGASPLARRDYTLTTLADDVIGLVDAVDTDRFHVVGHDWGGAVAWQLGAAHADRVLSANVMSTPHPRAMIKSLVTSTQLLKSWYMLAFQPPWLAERFLASPFGQNRLRTDLAATGMAPDQVEESLRLLASPSGRTMLNWYRALPLSPGGGPGKVTVPTLYLYGAKDFALGRKAAEGTAEFVTGPYRFEVLENAGHWMIDTDQGEVTASILDHLASIQP